MELSKKRIKERYIDHEGRKVTGFWDVNSWCGVMFFEKCCEPYHITLYRIVNDGYTYISQFEQKGGLYGKTSPNPC